MPASFSVTLFLITNCSLIAGRVRCELTVPTTRWCDLVRYGYLTIRPYSVFLRQVEPPLEGTISFAEVFGRFRYGRFLGSSPSTKAF